MNDREVFFIADDFGMTVEANRAIVHAATDLNTLNWSHVLHGHARHLARLLKVRFDLSLPRVTTTSLGCEESSRLFLAEECVLTHTGVLIE